MKLHIESKKCFLCSKILTNKTKEHIVPRWLLGLSSLFDYKNNNRHEFNEEFLLDYSKMYLPACFECNNGILSQIEADMKNVVSSASNKNNHICILDRDHKVLTIWFLLFAYKLSLLDKMKFPLNSQDSPNTIVKTVVTNYHKILEGDPFELCSIIAYRPAHSKKGSFDWWPFPQICKCCGCHGLFFEINGVVLYCMFDYGFYRGNSTPSVGKICKKLEGSFNNRFFDKAEFSLILELLKCISLPKLIKVDSAGKIYLDGNIKILRKFDIDLPTWVKTVYAVDKMYKTSDKRGFGVFVSKKHFMERLRRL